MFTVLATIAAYSWVTTLLAVVLSYPDKPNAATGMLCVFTIVSTLLLIGYCLPTWIG